MANNRFSFLNTRLFGIKLFYIVESFPLLFLFIITGYSNLTSTEVLGLLPGSWLKITVFAPLSITVVLPILAKLMGGFKDFRSRIFYHVVMLIVLVVAINAVSFGTGTFTTETSFIDGMLNYLAIVAVAVIPGIIGLFGLFSEAEIPLYELQNATQNIQAGNFDYRIDNKAVLRDSVFGAIASSLNETIIVLEQLVDSLDATSIIEAAVAEMNQTAETVNAGAEEVASTSQSMSQVATQQAESVEQVNSQIHQVDMTIEDVIAQISENSKVVAQIALQTNILALNAGIEASRAGDYGRGFAVVAENVRRLSEESKNAASEITEVSNQITNVLKQNFNDITLRIEELAALSEETAASAEEVASAAEEVTSSMEELSASTNDLYGYVEETRSSYKARGIDHLVQK